MLYHFLLILLLEVILNDTLAVYDQLRNRINKYTGLSKKIELFLPEWYL